MSGITCTNIRVAPGKRIGVKGEVPLGAKGVVMNFGKNEEELLLHFNPRFDAHGDVRTIVCNSKSGGKWGKEHRESHFPFQEGAPTEIIFSFDKNEVTCTLPGNHVCKFPNTTGHETVEYICIGGDFIFKGMWTD